MNVNILTLEDVKRLVNEELNKRLGAVQNQPKEEYLDPARVCEELGVSPRTFQRYRDEHRIAFIQRGRKIYVKRSDLDAFQEANRIEAQ